MDEAAHLLQFFFLDELQRVEILDFSRDLAGELGCIKLRDACHAALACEQVAPDLFRGVPHPADQTNASDYDPSRQLLSAFRVLSDVINASCAVGILSASSLIMMELELALPGDRFLPWRFEEGLLRVVLSPPPTRRYMGAVSCSFRIILQCSIQSAQASRGTCS